MIDNKKQIIKNHVFAPFVEACGGNLDTFTDIVFSEYIVINDKLNDDILFDKVIQYFKTKVVPHKIAVFNAGKMLITKSIHKELNVDENVFMNNLWLHDISKFSINESIGYATYDFELKEKSAIFNAAWEHHLTKNHHHSQHWLIEIDNKIAKLQMPRTYILEMIADWIGAGEVYGTPMEEWLKSNLHKFVWNKRTADNVKKLLERLDFKIEQEDEVLKVV